MLGYAILIFHPLALGFTEDVLIDFFLVEKDFTDELCLLVGVGEANIRGSGERRFIIRFSNLLWKLFELVLLFLVDFIAWAKPVYDFVLDVYRICLTGLPLDW